MLMVDIESVALTITNAEGHEHRVRPIVERAAALLAERAESYYVESPVNLNSRTWNRLSAAPVTVDLQSTNDEHIAHDVALAWVQALWPGFR